MATPGAEDAEEEEGGEGVGEAGGKRGGKGKKQQKQKKEKKEKLQERFFLLTIDTLARLALSPSPDSVPGLSHFILIEWDTGPCFVPG